METTAPRPRSRPWVVPRPASSGPTPPTDRPWGGSDPPGVAYVYAPDRKAERPIAHLEGFKGVFAGRRLMPVTAKLGRPRRRPALRFCWSHVRRNFYELATPGPSPIASESAPTYRRALRRRETTSAAAAADERHMVRQQEEPAVNRYPGTVAANKTRPDQSEEAKLAEAIRYTLSRWEGLTRFIDDGRIELDKQHRSNAPSAPIALNRKNALFAGV